MSDPLETRASLIRRLPDPANASAWDEFSTIYAPLVYRLARRQGLQPCDADDVVQEVMASVAEQFGQFLAWLQARGLIVSQESFPVADGKVDLLKYPVVKLTTQFRGQIVAPTYSSTLRKSRAMLKVSYDDTVFSEFGPQTDQPTRTVVFWEK
jgi:hypothetical protein